MQERSDGPLFVETVLGSEGKDVDAAKLMIGRLANRSLDSDNRIRVGRLPQHFEKGFGFAHRRSRSRRIHPLNVSISSGCGKAHGRDGARHARHGELIHAIHRSRHKRRHQIADNERPAGNAARRSV
jgi:hypothetical protein